MIVTYSKNAIPIRITQERWGHITRRHPEMRDQQDKVIETLSNPDSIQEGDFGELLRELSGQDGFVLTAYFTITPSKRRSTLWKP